VQIIVADIATETGRTIISESIEPPIDYLLHNAAILDNPQQILDLTVSDFRNNIATNVEPIIFFTQKLTHLFKTSPELGRILSISSEAAKQAIAGLGNYCVSKAAALMANHMLKAEMPKHGIIVNDYFPGVVDTGMQETLRSSTTTIFPYSDKFKQMKIDKQLIPPSEIAAHILDIFINSTDNDFKDSEWIFKAHNVLDIK